MYGILTKVSLASNKELSNGDANNGMNTHEEVRIIDAIANRYAAHIEMLSQGMSSQRTIKYSGSRNSWNKNKLKGRRRLEMATKDYKYEGKKAKRPKTPHPTKSPSFYPSTSPSARPSRSPSNKPSLGPSSTPSTLPSTKPSVGPSNTPTSNPSSSPSVMPSSSPSSMPSSAPSMSPSAIPSSAPSSCTCPLQATSTDTVWSAQVLVDMIGASTTLDDTQLDFYLEELRRQLEEVYNLKCPENRIQIESLSYSGQVYTNTTIARLLSGRTHKDNRRQLADGTNRVDQRVSVRYRAPPPRPMFSRLTTSAINSGSNARSRRLDDERKTSIETSIYQDHFRYVGAEGIPKHTLDGSRHRNYVDRTGGGFQEINAIWHHRNKEEVTYFVSNHINEDQHFSFVPFPRTKRIRTKANDSTSDANECKPDADLLSRLRVSQDKYWQEVEGISALVIESSFSFSFDFGMYN